MAYYKISSGLSSTGIILNGDRMFISSGGTANSTTINYWGEMYISSDGVANSTTINDWGSMRISSGGTANSTTINSGGYMDIYSGGTATNITANSDAIIGITVASNTYIQGTYNGSAFEMKNAFISGYTINSGGHMSISSGGTANSTTINSGGCMSIYSGGTANSTTINSGGCMSIYSGGTANSTTINSRGDMRIASGGVANNTTINSGGDMYISSGGTANSTTINDWSDMRISSGGVANSTTINSGGYMDISSGGTATDIIENGGCVYVADGAYATFASNTIEGFVLSYGNMTIHKNTIANSTTILHGGYMYIKDGGTANSTTINFGGDMYIEYGGTANSTTINSHGYMHISSGGTANSTTINSSGHMYISAGGTANSTTILHGGYMSISSGGTATNIIENGGYVYVANGAYATFASNTIEVFVLSNANMTVHKNTIANSTTINSRGDMYIFSGGVANSTTINSSGSMRISSGGVANSTTINSSGSMSISSGGVANSTTINNGGYMHISSGGTATNITANSSARIGITVASNTYIQGTYNGSAFEMKDAFISGYTIHSRGSMYIGSGGTATNITANSSAGIGITVASNTYIQGTYNGSAFEMKDAFISGYTIHSRGDMDICSGGTANSTTINSGGNMRISSGGTATDIIENGGYVYVADDAFATFASNTIEGFFLSYDRMTVHKNTIANSTTINGGPMDIYSGGVANSTTINYWGSMRISSGGTANDTTINYLGGMYIENGGVANSTTINSRGSMYISSGGVHRGSLQIESSAVVSAYSGGIIDFTVADRTSADDYLINNLSLIKGAPTYTITVSENQEAGTYKLAQGASALNGTISICTEDSCFGSLTINGDVLTVDGVTYDLNNVDGDLTLTITVLKPEYIVGNFNGMFEFTPDGSGSIYTPAGKQEIAGTIDPESWELVGAGDFNKSGTDGLLWVEKETGYVYVQNDLTNFNEVNNKSNCLGVLGEGYNILGTGDFTGTGISGVVMQGPAFGDESISLNYGLPIWGREADGTTFAGWLGALVNTWQPDDALKGDTSDLADINAKNYMYEVVSVGDYNGDGVDDVMLQNIMPENVDGVTITGSGDVFTFLTGDMAAVKAGASPTVAYAGCATDGWEIVGSGDFDSDGIDDVLLSDGTGVAGWKMVNGQRIENQWFGNLGETEEISGITDLNNDGTDDILILNTATDTYSGWLVKDGVITGSLAIA